MWRRLYNRFDVTIMDLVLIVCTCGLWLLWLVPRNIYRRDRNKKAVLTWYQTNRSIKDKNK